VINDTPIQLELPLDDAIEFSLTKGQVTIVDRVDADLALLKWHAHFSPSYANGGNFLAKRSTPRINGKHGVEYLHRVILSRMLGRPLLHSEWVDHEDLNPLNNRRENLRLATPSQNQVNKGKRTDNSSGFTGVSWRKDRRKWVARIWFNGKKYQLGNFDTKEAAHDAYIEKAKELHGEFARLE